MNNKRGRSWVLVAALCIIFCIIAGFIAMRNRQAEVQVPIPAVEEHMPPATNATPAFVPSGGAIVVPATGVMQFPAVTTSTTATAVATNASVTTAVNASTASRSATGGR